ncbi:MAG: hypothetical protein KDE58_28045, partial [Caldilineaceae bacterium]|nr:hypothetical protein [Caldilineaceae bacterium]
MVAVATSQASAHEVSAASPVALNYARVQEKATDVENSEGLAGVPQFRYADTRSAPQFSQTATHGDNSPYTLLRALANDWVIKWRTVSSPTIYLPYVTHIFTQPATMSLAERIGFGL